MSRVSLFIVSFPFVIHFLEIEDASETCDKTRIESLPGPASLGRVSMFFLLQIISSIPLPYNLLWTPPGIEPLGVPVDDDVTLPREREGTCTTSTQIHTSSVNDTLLSFAKPEFSSLYSNTPDDGPAIRPDGSRVSMSYRFLFRFFFL